MSNCIFCKIAARKADAFVVAESENTISFLDVFPKAVGHSLIVPKKHFESLWEMPAKVRSELFDEASRAGPAIMNATGAKGLDLIQHHWPFVPELKLKKAHVHVHLIPRDKNDAIFRNPSVRLEPTQTEMQVITEKIRTELSLAQTKLI